MPTTTLPSIKDVRDMLTDLLGKDVTMAPSAPVEPDKPIGIGIGVFVDDSAKMAAIAVADLRLAAYIGCRDRPGAPGRCRGRDRGRHAARDDQRQLHRGAQHPLGAVQHPRLAAPAALRRVLPGPGAATDVSTTIRGHGGRLDLDVTLAGYGQGRLSFVLAF